MTKSEKIAVKVKALRVLRDVLQNKITWVTDDVASSFRFLETDKWIREQYSGLTATLAELIGTRRELDALLSEMVEQERQARNEEETK